MKMALSLKKTNPVLLLVLFSLAAFVLRKFLFPEYSDAALVGIFEELLAAYGYMGMVYLLCIYFLCSFFFIPILIPLNIVCGAMYGPFLGALVAMGGVLLSCVASTLSVRYVFRGMGAYATDHKEVKKFLNQITRHGIVVAIIVRLAFVVPYLLQNIVLAMTNIRLGMLLALTLVGALPGVVSYAFLGAGLVSLDNAGAYSFYLLVPLMLLIGVSFLIKALRRSLGIGRTED